MNKLIGVMIGGMMLVMALAGWLFTLLIDWPLLILVGYPFSFVVYRVLARRWKWLGMLAMFLVPVNIIALWLGGVLPYFNLMAPSAVYFGLIPADVLGLSGNDFMWNGFLFVLLGKRLVPLVMQPTFQYLGFNLVAVLIWLGMPMVLVWSAFTGFADSTIPAPWWKVFVPGMGKMVVTAMVVEVVLVALTQLLVWLYA